MGTLKQNSIEEAIKESLIGGGVESSLTERFIDGILDKITKRGWSLQEHILDGNIEVEEINVQFTMKNDIRSQPLVSILEDVTEIVVDAIEKASIDSEKLYSIVLSNAYTNPSRPLVPVLTAIIKTVK